MDIIKAENEKYNYWVGFDDVVSITYIPAEHYKYGEAWMTEPASAKIYFNDGTYAIIYNLIRVVFKGRNTT